MTSTTGSPGAAAPVAPGARTAPVSAARLLVGVFVVALNLRAAITVVPPLARAIETELGLSGAVMGAVTALPVLCMGLFAPIGARLAHRVGRERAVGLSLLALALGQAVRAGGDQLGLLLLGTLLAGLGIAVCGTVMPGIVKEFFAGRTGVMTGVYMFSMTIGGSAASAVAVPLAEALGGWTWSLAVWSLVAVVGLATWLPIQRGVRRSAHASAAAHAEPVGVRDARQGLPWRSRTAWLLSLHMLLGSYQFYSHLAWLPSAYADRGWSTTSAGLLLAVYQIAQLITGVAGSALTDRVVDRRRLLLPGAASMLIALIGLTTAPDLAPWLWAVTLGLGTGMTFAVGLVLLVDYAGRPADSARLSSMVFLVSYSVAALGPTAFGALRDLSGSFTTPWGVLAALSLLHLVVVSRLRPDRRAV